MHTGIQLERAHTSEHLRIIGMYLGGEKGYLIGTVLYEKHSTFHLVISISIYPPLFKTLRVCTYISHSPQL